MTSDTAIHPAVGDAMETIRTHCDRPLSLEMLAGRAGISPFHFHRLFRSDAGQPLGEYVRRVRLQKGARLLRSTDQKVVDVAFDCGYQSHEAFSRAFQKWTGLSPTQFRERSAGDRPVTLPEAEPFGRGGEGVSDPVLGRWPGCWFAFVQHVGPYQLIDRAFGRVFAARAASEDPSGTVMGIAYDDPDLTPAERLRYEAGFAVSRPEACPRGLSVRRIEAGPVVSVTVTGDYERLAGGYDRLYGDGVRTAGGRFRDEPPFLVYRSGGLAADRPDGGGEHRTDIVLPLGGD